MSLRVTYGELELLARALGADSPDVWDEAKDVDAAAARERLVARGWMDAGGVVAVPEEDRATLDARLRATDVCLLSADGSWSFHRAGDVVVEDHRGAQGVHTLRPVTDVAGRLLEAAGLRHDNTPAGPPVTISRDAVDDAELSVLRGDFDAALRQVPAAADYLRLVGAGRDFDAWCSRYRLDSSSGVELELRQDDDGRIWLRGDLDAPGGEEVVIEHVPTAELRRRFERLLALDLSSAPEVVPEQPAPPPLSFWNKWLGRLKGIGVVMIGLGVLLPVLPGYELVDGVILALAGVMLIAAVGRLRGF